MILGDITGSRTEGRMEEFNACFSLSFLYVILASLSFFINGG